MDPLLVGARGLWEDLASVPVSFAPTGGVSVVVSPQSRMCPPGWVGVVTLGGSAIVTVLGEDAAVVVRDAFATLPVGAVADADAARGVLPHPVPGTVQRPIDPDQPSRSLFAAVRADFEFSAHLAPVLAALTERLCLPG